MEKEATPADKTTTKKKGLRGVVYLGHIPDGFFEPQIRKYFNQFGKVQKVRLSRSKKSARSKGYGFVKFARDDVAKIAASAMNNYLMFEKLLKCVYVPPEKVHPETFKGAGLPFKKSYWPILNAIRQNRPKSSAKLATLKKRTAKQMTKRNAKLNAMGINYSFTAADAEMTKQEMKKEEPRESESRQETSTLSVENFAHDQPSVVIDVEDNVSFEIPQGARVRYRGRGTAKKLAKKSKKISPLIEVKEELGSDLGIVAPKLKKRKKSKKN